MQLQDLHLVTWSHAVVTSVAIIKHGHSPLGADAPPEHNMTMLACGTSNPSVITFMIEDAVLHMLNMLQQRLGVFSESSRKRSKTCNSVWDVSAGFTKQRKLLLVVAIPCQCHMPVEAIWIDVLYSLTWS